MRPETSPEDIEGMIASEAIVTTHGGMTSHAAVVARGMGKCCVTGCSDLEINTVAKTVYYDGGNFMKAIQFQLMVLKVTSIGEIETVSAEHSVESSLNLWNGQRILHA